MSLNRPYRCYVVSQQMATFGETVDVISKVWCVQVADASDIEPAVSAKLWRIASSRHGVSVSKQQLSAADSCHCQSEHDVRQTVSSASSSQHPVTASDSHAAATQPSPVCRCCDYCC